MANPKIVGCPNCGKNAIREGDIVTCTTCDAQFGITLKDGARVQSVGRLDSLDARMTALESKKGKQEPVEPQPNVTEKDGSEDGPEEI